MFSLSLSLCVIYIYESRRVQIKTYIYSSSLNCSKTFLKVTIEKQKYIYQPIIGFRYIFFFSLSCFRYLNSHSCAPSTTFYFLSFWSSCSVSLSTFTLPHPLCAHRTHTQIVLNSAKIQIIMIPLQFSFFLFFIFCCCFFLIYFLRVWMFCFFSSLFVAALMCSRQMNISAAIVCSLSLFFTCFLVVCSLLSIPTCTPIFFPYLFDGSMGVPTICTNVNKSNILLYYQTVLHTTCLSHRYIRVYVLCVCVFVYVSRLSGSTHL